MELEISKLMSQQERGEAFFDKVLSCCLSNKCTLHQFSVQNEEKPKKIQPFKIVKNYRQLQKNSYRRQRKNKQKPKRKFSETQPIEQMFQIKKFRKMTESIQIDQNSEQSPQKQNKYPQFKLNLQSRQEQESLYFLYDNPQLEKMIPFEMPESKIQFDSLSQRERLL